MNNYTHTCQFCDHLFTGRRRKFCYDCLPEHGVAGSETYMKRYNDLNRACGFNGPPPSSRWKPPTSMRSAWRSTHRPARPPKHCKGCGVEVDGRRQWCNQKCARKHKRRNIRPARADVNPVALANQVAPVVRWIVRPGKEINKVDPRRLAFIQRCAELPPLGANCKTCGVDLVAWWTLRPGQRSCPRCYECAMDASNRGGKWTGPATTIDFVAICLCRNCGKEFERRWRLHASCSDECAAQLKRDLNRRKMNARRTAMTGEPYSLHDLFVASGGKCHICGNKVNMNLSGSHPNGPTVDHLLPLSDGGFDCRTNVALAHRQCNVKRGTGGTVQLRLVG